MKLDALNKYIEATQDHLGVEYQRYVGGFRAIVAHRLAVDFLFEMLGGDGIESTEARSFLDNNPLFPSATGKTPQDALQKLSDKLELLYQFEPDSVMCKWTAVPRFKLQAQYDADSSESGHYDVCWDNIVDDLESDAHYFYKRCRAECSGQVRRDLHALVEFKYEGIFASLKNKGGLWIVR